MRMLTAVVLSLVLAEPGRAQVPGGIASRYPLRAVSPSGEWELTVDGTNGRGWGAGTCRVERNGELAWEAELPFTFTEAGVTDAGVTAGIVGQGGTQSDSVLAVIDETGAFRLREVIEREPRKGGSPVCSFGVMVGSPPTPSRMLLDAANDRVLFRPKTTWLGHRLSDGLRTHDLDPLAFVPPEFRERARVLRAWRCVPDTGLVLAEWSPSLDPKLQRSACFALFDRDLHAVWTFAVPQAPKKSARERLAQRAASESDPSVRIGQHLHSLGTHILDIGPEGAFSVASMETLERVDLRAARSNFGWRVDEIGREALVAPPDESAKALEKIAHLPELALELIARAPLRSGSHVGSTGRKPVAALPGKLGVATVDSLDRLLVRDERTGAIHGFDASGLQVLVAQPSAADLEQLDSSPGSSRIPAVSPAGDVFLEWSVKQGEGSSSAALWRLHFAPDGRRIGLEPSLGLDRWNEQWLFQPNAPRRWVLGISDLHWIDDATGERRNFARGPDGRWLGVVLERNVAVGADGSLAFLSQTRDERGEQVECVHLFSGDGKPLRTLHLDIEGYLAMDLLFTGDRLLFPRMSWQWLALDLAGEPTARYELSVVPEDYGRGDAFVAARGRELWVFARQERELWRFALP